MLIFEAINELSFRIALEDDYYNQIPEYFEALKKAVKCMEACQIICDYLNDGTLFNNDDLREIMEIVDENK